ncbi:hypothetical protein KP79_PYT19375 [Mizuhopecten yessoensis]|uniref:Uncharacterized protein n=2 Tax=Mizuhopecten yessoensis TaxID=6573 RepID=A0A210QNY6_MIZYE|nr:hypothetical protein KP79_PYT19375 [Mizuhopecten yessoensis]
MTVKLVNSTKIGESLGSSGCPCNLSITFSLTDSRSCQCQPLPGGCTQCNVVVTTPTDVKIDTGNGGGCDMNNSFPGKTKLHLRVTVRELGNAVLILRPNVIGTFCQPISLDKRQSLYNASDGRHSSLLMEVTSTLTTTTPKTVTTSKNFHPGISTTVASYGAKKETNGDDASLSTGAIAGIVFALLVILAIVILLIDYCHKRWIFNFICKQKL